MAIVFSFLDSVRNAISTAVSEVLAPARAVSNRAKWCPRFQNLKISLRSQDFYGISIFHRDFKISYGFQDLNEISQDLTQIL